MTERLKITVYTDSPETQQMLDGLEVGNGGFCSEHGLGLFCLFDAAKAPTWSNQKLYHGHALDCMFETLQGVGQRLLDRMQDMLQQFKDAKTGPQM